MNERNEHVVLRNLKVLVLLVLSPLFSLAQIDMELKPGAKFKRTPDPMADVVSENYQDKKVIRLIEFMGDGYWKIALNGNITYTSDVWFYRTPQYERVLAKAEEDYKKSPPAAVYKPAALSKAALIKRYGSKYGTDAYNGIIRLGCTKSLVQYLLGEPTSINRTAGSWGVDEQWVYQSKNEYYYFRNGRLTSWQD